MATYKPVKLEEIKVGQPYGYKGTQPAINTIVHVISITDEHIIVEGWDREGPFTDGHIKKQVFIDNLDLVEDLDPQYYVKPELRASHA
jgi:hypothetical protein